MINTDFIYTPDNNFTDFAKSLFVSIVESTEDAIIGLDLEGVIIIWNKGAEMTYGYKREEVVGKLISFLVPEDRLEISQNILEKLKNNEKIERYEAEHLRKNGERIVVSLAVSHFVDITTGTAGFSIISRDITPSKVAEMALKESENFKNTILSSVKHGIAVIGLDGKIKLWNRFMEEFTQIPSKDALMKPASEIMSFLTKEKFEDFFYKAISGQTLPSYRAKLHTKIRVEEKKEFGKSHIADSSIKGTVLFSIKGLTSDDFITEKWLSVSFAPHYAVNGEIVGSVATVADISKRVASELELQNTNLKLSALINSSPAAIFILDKEKRITLWNLAAEKMFLYKSSDVINSIIPIIPKNFSQEFQDIFQATLNGDVISNSEIVLNRNNNTNLIASLSSSPLLDNEGEVTGMIGIVIDISKRKNFEKALQESQNRFIELYDNMSSGVVFYEPIQSGNDFIIKDLNPAAAKIENVNKEDVIRKKLSELTPRDLNKGLFEAMKKVWLSGKPAEFPYTFYKDINNIAGWRKNYIYKLPSGDIVSIFDDTSQRIASEEALKESEERYRGFVQNFKGIAFRWTLDYRPLLFHGSVKEITGYEEKDFTEGRIKWDDIILSEDLQSIKLQNDKVGVMPNYEHDFEYRILRKDGQDIWVHEHLQNICGEDNKLLYIQGTIYSITERKKAEFDLKRSQEQLRNLAIHLETAREEEKKRIALEIHDELGHALTALKLDLAWLLKKKFLRRDALLEKIQQMYELIEVTIRKVRLISTELRPSVLDHFGLVAAIEWQAKEFQKRTGCRTRLTITPQEISVDEYHTITLFRIFQEILTNVARHANASRVDVSLELKENSLYLKVSDNGKGIKQDQITDVKSFGIIGMNERTNALGGSLNISGISGIGTTITVRLPINP